MNKVKEKKKFNKIWNLYTFPAIIVLLISLVCLVASYFFGKNVQYLFLSNALLNLFGGLVTGLIIYTLSNIRNYLFLKNNRQRQFLNDASELFEKYRIIRTLQCKIQNPNLSTMSEFELMELLNTFFDLVYEVEQCFIFLFSRNKWANEWIKKKFNFNCEILNKCHNENLHFFDKLYSSECLNATNDIFSITEKEAIVSNATLALKELEKYFENEWIVKYEAIQEFDYSSNLLI